MAFEISEFVDPIVPPNKKGGPRSEFGRKMENLPVGKAIIITGMTQNNVSSRVSLIRGKNPGKVFSVANLLDGRFQITRVK